MKSFTLADELKLMRCEFLEHAINQLEKSGNLFSHFLERTHRFSLHLQLVSEKSIKALLIFPSKTCKEKNPLISRLRCRVLISRRIFFLLQVIWKQWWYWISQVLAQQGQPHRRGFWGVWWGESLVNRCRSLSFNFIKRHFERYQRKLGMCNGYS